MHQVNNRLAISGCVGRICHIADLLTRRDGQNGPEVTESHLTPR
jgi:hypothetical protein